MSRASRLGLCLLIGLAPCCNPNGGSLTAGGSVETNAIPPEAAESFSQADDRDKKFALGANAAVFNPPDFRAEHPAIASLAGATGALFCTSQLDQPTITIEKLANSACGGSCGHPVDEIVKAVGKTPVAPGLSAGGVLVASNVLAAPRHRAQDFLDDVDELTVVFDFQGTTPKLKPLRVVQLCRGPVAVGDLALIQLDVEGHVDLPAPQTEIADPCSTTTISGVLAVGHPFGAARLITGANKDTHIHDCRNHGGMGIHASLDAVDGSSGSAVYIPHADTDGWILYGLLGAGFDKTLSSRGLTSRSSVSDVCAEGAIGPTITPLGGLPRSVIDEVANGKTPSGWTCRTPNGKIEGVVSCAGKDIRKLETLSPEDQLGVAKACTEPAPDSPT